MHWRYTTRWTGIVCGKIYNPFCWCSRHLQRPCNVVTAPRTKVIRHFLTIKTSWTRSKQSPHDSVSRCDRLLLEWIPGASQQAQNTWYSLLPASIHLSIDLWIYLSYVSLFVYIYLRSKQPSSASDACLSPPIFSTLPESWLWKESWTNRIYTRTHWE